MTQNRLSEAQQRWVRISDITIDERANREIRDSHIAYLTSNFDPTGIGAVTLSKRDDGALIPLDGMHRVKAMQDLGMGDTQVSAMVYEGLSAAAESAMFVMLNVRLNLHPLIQYRHGVKAGLAPYVSINDIVRSAGLRVGFGPNDLRCVGALRKLYDDDPEGKTLSMVVHIMASAWGDEATKAGTSAMVRGLGAVLRRYQDQIDVESLAGRLAGFKAKAVLAQGRDKAHSYSTNLTQGVARAVTDIYNGSRRRGRLADWPTS